MHITTQSLIDPSIAPTQMCSVTANARLFLFQEGHLFMSFKLMNSNSTKHPLLFNTTIEAFFLLPLHTY